MDADYIYTSEAAAQAFFFNNCPLPKEIRNNIWAEVKDFAHFKILQAQRSDALKEALIAVGLSDQELTDEMIAETLSFIGFIEKKKAAPKDSDKE